MASIDQYKHRLLGFIECPSKYDFVYQNSTRNLAVYELMENIPADEKDFDGKTGDILIGGGSGEAPAFRITMPDCLEYFIFDKAIDFENNESFFKAFWNPTQSFKLGDGFQKLGWDVVTPMEVWLTKNVCTTLINETEKYKKLHSGPKLITALKWKSVEGCL